MNKMRPTKLRLHDIKLDGLTDGTEQIVSLLQLCHVFGLSHEDEADELSANTRMIESFRPMVSTSGEPRLYLAMDHIPTWLLTRNASDARKRGRQREAFLLERLQRVYRQVLVMHEMKKGITAEEAGTLVDTVLAAMAGKLELDAMAGKLGL